MSEPAGLSRRDKPGGTLLSSENSAVESALKSVARRLAWSFRMRSIRLSLVGYFLVLLMAASGAVGYYVFHLTQATLEDKERKDIVQLDRSYEAQCVKFQENLDDEILLRAQAVVHQMRVQWGGRDTLTRYSPAGLFLASVTPVGSFHTPVWFSEGRFGDPRFALMATRVQRDTSLKLWLEDDPYLAAKVSLLSNLRPGPGTLWSSVGSLATLSTWDSLLSSADQAELEYFQIFDGDTNWNSLYRSPSLRKDSLSFEPPAGDEPVQLLRARFDGVELKAGYPLRRVTLKIPVTKYRILFPSYANPKKSYPARPDPFHRPPASPPTFPAQFPPPPGFVDRSVPTVIVQFARYNRCPAEFASYKQQLDSDQAKVQTETRATLASLRSRLLMVGSILFLATAVGGIWLVHRGLRPMQRIAQAVGLVSEKDFHLRLQESEVPTELLPIVSKLKEALASLERAFAREKQAAADISHELRTPLAALLTTVQVCLKKPRQSVEYRETLETCQEICQQLNILVERLLLLARLDAGVDKLQRESFDLAELASQCVSLVKPLAEARGLNVRIERNGPIPAHTDSNKIREILTNLLHNAIQYNRPDGSVTLVVDRQNGHASLEVRDTGLGIPAHARAHLFERFYRVDPSRQSDTTHAGLGLAIVKGYLELMQGQIEVDSVEGEGSTFRIKLPLASTAERN
jgi:heavy metal sensor kinase